MKLTLEEGSMLVWDRQGRRGRIKNLLSKCLVLSKQLERTSAERDEGIKEWRTFQASITRFFGLEVRIPHFFGLKERREELRTSVVQMDKAKEMRSSLHSQHVLVHTDLV